MQNKHYKQHKAVNTPQIDVLISECESTAGTPVLASGPLLRAPLPSPASSHLAGGSRTQLQSRLQGLSTFFIHQTTNSHPACNFQRTTLPVCKKGNKALLSF